MFIDENKATGWAPKERDIAMVFQNYALYPRMSVRQNIDEPLSNLDAKLRVSMRAELARLHRRYRITTVYVTHDQVEAMTLGDRIAVIDKGRLQQVGTPQELYRAPANRFVAGFMGSPSMNFAHRCGPPSFSRTRTWPSAGRCGSPST